MFTYAGMVIGFTLVGSTVAAIVGWGILRGIMGRGTVVGGNVFLLESVPEGSRVVGEPPRHLVRQHRGANRHQQLHWDI